MITEDAVFFFKKELLREDFQKFTTALLLVITL